jgi:hypothetical protein
MNERNISALRELIDEWRTREGGLDLPRFLASHGVLAAAAITDDDGVAIAADASSAAKERGEIALCVRLRLEGIAKGAAIIWPMMAVAV